MSCAACKARGKTWQGSDPKCAFDALRFSPRNWNCATLDGLRDLVYEGNEHPAGVDYQYCDDYKYASINVTALDEMDGALCMWVAWYKNRGETESVYLLYSHKAPARPTEKQVLAVSAHYAIVRAAASLPPKEPTE